MGRACPPEYSNAVFPLLDGADATDSPVPNSNAITNRKSPRGHLSPLSVFPAVTKEDARSRDFFFLRNPRLAPSMIHGKKALKT
jgi:hypothetical protein